MCNFDCLEKGLRIFSPLHLVYDFSTKMLYSINSPNFIVLLPLLHKILGNMCIAIICFPGSDVMNFEINVFINDQKVK